MQLKKRYYLAKLISKLLLDTASVEEKKQFETWLNASPENSEMYNRWMKRLHADLLQGESVDTNKEWDRFQRRIHPSSYIIRRTSVRWTAAATLALLVPLSGVFYFFY